MRVTPALIARAVADLSQEGEDASRLDRLCDTALQLLHSSCPHTTKRTFLSLVERELNRRHAVSAGMLLVPHERSIRAEHIAPLITKKSAKPIHLQRVTEPELIGGAVLLVDHRRIDCSVQGALRQLLRACLEPLD
jgi:hypothetical protein